MARADAFCPSTGFVALQAQSDQLAQQQARLLRELAQVDETLRCLVLLASAQGAVNFFDHTINFVPNGAAL